MPQHPLQTDYDAEDAHLKETLLFVKNHLSTMAKENGQTEEEIYNKCFKRSIDLSKVTRALIVYIMNRDIEKANKKLKRFRELASECMEDMLEGGENFACGIVEEGFTDPVDGDEEALFGADNFLTGGKDGEYKQVCDTFMAKTKRFEMAISYIHKMPPLCRLR